MRWGGVGAIVPATRAVVLIAKSTRWQMAPNGFGYRPEKSLEHKGPSCAISFMLANIWERLPQVAGRKHQSAGAELNRTDSSEEHWKKSSTH